MNGIFLCSQPAQVQRVYGGGRMDQVRRLFTMAEPVVTKKSIGKQQGICRGAEVVFSTWGMPALKEEEIKTYFPRLKAVFYAAGSVQEFARPFLARGVRVFSAWGANAVPVAEYTFAQITLAAKGYFQSVRKTSWTRASAYRRFASMPGNFETNVGLIGAGMIGSMVAQRLRNLDVNVFVFDPFLSRERAEELHVVQTDLQSLFETCDVISNHLANNSQTKGMLNRECFDRMKPGAVFINTGRGAQIVEKDLVKAMRREKGRLALLDVTFPEPPRIFSPLNFTKNILLTPHMAGSSGQELWRMADYMIEQSIHFKENLPVQWEVTKDMLDTMA